MISEQVAGGTGWTTLYDAPVSSTRDDSREVEGKAPLWMLESLLSNKVPLPNPVKVSFMVTPWNKGDDAPLPELLSR